MAQSGTKQPQTRISGQIIIDELVRNMELGCLELGYSILLPCLFSVYLHPDDYNRLIGVQDLIKEDARRALTARMAEWNKKSPAFRRGGPRKEYKIAQSTWWIELFSDGENAVPPGDVEIHSELNDVVQPGYRGTKTTLIERQPSVTAARVVRDRESTPSGRSRLRRDSLQRRFRPADVLRNAERSQRGARRRRPLGRPASLLERPGLARTSAIAPRPGNGFVCHYRPEPQWHLAEWKETAERVGSRAARPGRNPRGRSHYAQLRGAQMRWLYDLHIPFVIAFLAFVVLFIVVHAREGRS